jgi:peptidoglycan-N-acetylglucosamine deacetylase
MRAWGLAGHLVGNHTATHPDFGAIRTSLPSFEAELLACEAAIHTLPGFTKLFRFPYLKEGNTREKRDGFRVFLKSSGYRQGRVSIDTSDWYYNQRLRERLMRDPTADRTAYRDAYLKHLYDRAVYYDDLSQRVLGRSVKHVMLMHHNLINALFLADVIPDVRARGMAASSTRRCVRRPGLRDAARHSAGGREHPLGACEAAGDRGFALARRRCDPTRSRCSMRSGCKTAAADAAAV